VGVRPRPPRVATRRDARPTISRSSLRPRPQLRHPRIVGYFDTFLDERNTVLCLVMEYCKRHNLAQKIEHYARHAHPPSERRVWRHLLEMAEGLAHLHSKRIIHRDLKARHPPHARAKRHVSRVSCSTNHPSSHSIGSR
jgi:serine/threonine protein kinase